MGLLTSRRKPPALADLAAFEFLTQALPLLAADGIRPTGSGSVCIKPSDKRYADLDGVVDQVASSGRYDSTVDDYGHRWLTRRTDPADVARLVTDLSSVNRALAGASVGAALLCTLLTFDTPAGRLALVYRPRRGTWYPFAPDGERTRDNMRELAIRDRLAGELSIETDLTKWSPLWEAPGLS